MFLSLLSCLDESLYDRETERWSEDPSNELGMLVGLTLQISFAGPGFKPKPKSEMSPVLRPLSWSQRLNRGVVENRVCPIPLCGVNDLNPVN